jgi:hypothetical protein
MTISTALIAATPQFVMATMSTTCMTDIFIILTETMLMSTSLKSANRILPHVPKDIIAAAMPQTMFMVLAAAMKLFRMVTTSITSLMVIFTTNMMGIAMTTVPSLLPKMTLRN